MNRKIRKAAVFYLSIQTLTAFVWWIGMLTKPEWRPLFFADPTAEMHWMSFFLPDMVLYLGAGGLAAIGFRHEHRWAWGVLLVHLGAVGYAALYSLTSLLMSKEGSLGSLLMLGSFLVVAWFAGKLKPY